MDRMLYIGMTGAKHHMMSLAAVNNNLANATTTGFREDFAQFRSMPVFGPGHPTRAYAMVERPGHNFHEGPLKTTGRNLDVAIDGEGWLAIQSREGSEAYTRAGELQTDVFGQLINSKGELVLGEDGPITIPTSETVEIARDGTISIRPVGQDAVGLVEVGRLKLVQAENKQMIKGEDGLFRHQSGQALEADANVRVIPGALEGSNVNIVSSMTEMISLQRNYEMQVKAMSAANEIAEQTASIMRVS